MSEVDQPPSEDQLARLRLAVLNAYLLAAERRNEVMDVVAEARDPEEARRSVAQLLGIPEGAASGVLELRLMRFSKSEVAQHRAEHETIKERLGEDR